MITDEYEPVIGIEIHFQLNTQSKMFCGCSATSWNEPPNSKVCPVCLGLPGALPVANKLAVEKAIMVGLALNCKPQLKSWFDRKNYFYPDLPKGYQISQYQLPLSVDGFIVIGGKKIRINRAHLEEDTAKLVHLGNKTLIDFNRAGIPLMEIVSEPDVTSAAQAKAYAQKIQQIVRFLGVSNADIEKGQMRLEPNISIRRKGEKGLPNYKVEVKNIGSFNSLEKAIEYEVDRQIKALRKGLSIQRETRGWKEADGKTFPQRGKELAHDYRYFPEPDLPIMKFNQSLIEKIKQEMPELPDERKKRLKTDFGLSEKDAEFVTRDVEMVDFFEETLLAYSTTKKQKKLSPVDALKVLNWIRVELLGNLNALGKKISEIDLQPAGLAEIVYLVDKGELTVHSAKLILAKWIKEGAKPSSVIKLMSKKMDISQIEVSIEKVIAENENAIADYRAGKKEAFNFLVGQSIKATGGKVDYKILTEVLKNKLEGK